MNNARFDRRLQLGFGVPIAVLLALSVVCYRSLVASTTGADSFRHAHQIIESLAVLLWNGSVK